MTGKKPKKDFKRITLKIHKQEHRTNRPTYDLTNIEQYNMFYLFLIFKNNTHFWILAGAVDFVH